MECASSHVFSFAHVCYCGCQGAVYPYGIVWYITVRYGTVQYRALWYGMVGYGMVWDGIVWCVKSIDIHLHEIQSALRWENVSTQFDAIHVFLFFPDCMYICLPMRVFSFAQNCQGQLAYSWELFYMH